MKKVFKVVGFIMLVLLIIAGCMAVWQRQNLASIIASTKYTKEELVQKIDDTKKDIEHIVDDYTGGTIRDFSHDEEEQIRRGEITAEQALSKILSEYTNNMENKTFNPYFLQSKSTEHNTNSNSIETATKDLNSVINEHIAQMYMLKAQYIGKLGEIERRAKADYLALPKEKRGSAGQQLIVSKYIGEAASLETECDGKVSESLESLQRNLKEFGGDLSLIKTIKKAYDDEKLLKKSYFINSYR